MGDAAVYPFSAIVGQEAMKRALVLAAIHPGLGGVLVRGSKGAAKSTAARGLAALLPDVETFEGDPFGRSPDEEIAGWPLPDSAGLARRPARFVTLPVGASEDRVVGSLDLEKALGSARRVFEPGLLASAHRGVLFIDEVNLLADHLVDLLLDVAAMGVNRVEREGVAFVHPSRFVLVGTMNPEEGDLRPQLLDRFGLVVEADSMTESRTRAEVVRRRLQFDRDPAGFAATWADSEREERQRIADARLRLPSIAVPEEVLDAICSRCAREGAEGLRADLTIVRAASALAAYDGRESVTSEDVEAVAEMALVHRRTAPAPPPGPRRPSVLDDSPADRPPDRPGGPRPPDSGGRSGASASGTDGLGAIDPEAGHPEAAPAEGPTVVRLEGPRGPRRVPASRSGLGGAASPSDRSGAVVGSTDRRASGRGLALAATIRQAAPRQALRRGGSGSRLEIRPIDVRWKLRERPTARLVLFCVDASRSMGARSRMGRTKAAVLSLLVDAYQKRDRVGLIAFGKGGARLVLPPSRSVREAARVLSDLPIGGATPLASGMTLAGVVADRSRRRDPGAIPFLVLLTDGRGNLPTSPGADPQAQSLAIAAELGRRRLAGLVIDTEAGPVRLGMAEGLARAWGVPCRRLDDLQGERLPDAIRRSILAQTA